MITDPRMTARALAALAALSLSACGDSGGDEEKGAGGVNKVLEGSVSDAMIRYDTLQSEAPPAKIALDDAEEKGGSGSPGTRRPSPAATGDAGDAPAASPDGPSSDGGEE